jgi:putative ABC transport system substrate-binding protein
MGQADQRRKYAPTDLPIEQPTCYELVINRKAATALGMQLSQTVLLRAYRMLE